MHEAQRMVDEFHRVFERQRPARPDFIGLDGRHRINLMREELFEFETGWEGRNPVEMIDALADLIYVTYGTAVAAGVDLAPYYAEVHASNMRKLWPDGKPRATPEGKILKPPGWVPPDLDTLYVRLKADPYPDPYTQALVAAMLKPGEAHVVFAGLTERVAALEAALATERESVKKHRERAERAEATNNETVRKNIALLDELREIRARAGP